MVDQVDDLHHPIERHRGCIMKWKPSDLLQLESATEKEDVVDGNKKRNKHVLGSLDRLHFGVKSALFPNQTLESQNTEGSPPATERGRYQTKGKYLKEGRKGTNRINGIYIGSSFN